MRSPRREVQEAVPLHGWQSRVPAWEPTSLPQLPGPGINPSPTPSRKDLRIFETTGAKRENRAGNRHVGTEDKVGAEDA